MNPNAPIPFAAFARFERLTAEKPLLYCAPSAWAAANHAIVWTIGHVRTHDFRTFEPNPHNPIFTPATDADAWDRDGLLTPQVFAINGTYYMIYAGLRGSGWNRVSAVGTGLAVAKSKSE